MKYLLANIALPIGMCIGTLAFILAWNLLARWYLYLWWKRLDPDCKFWDV